MRLLCVLRVIKFALPLAAMFCFGALGSSATAAESKKSSKSRSSATAKKASASKKSAKSKSSAKSSKSKSKQRSSKAKEKSETAQNSASLDWIDDLPEVELPEASGPPEDELLEPVPEPESAQPAP
jgi:cobalamin biosynthesis Mg chelatase CobN